MRKFTCFLVVMCICTAADAAPSSLVGLWGTKQIFGPQIRGRLVIDGRSKPWQASIAGFNVPVGHRGGKLRFVLPDGQGAFRAKLEPKSQRIIGQWIQAPGVTNNNSYATPIILRKTESGVWQGMVRPQLDILTLYLEIKRNTDGKLLGYFRNPQFNFGRGNPYELSVEGDTVRLVSTKNSRDKFVASYDVEEDILHLQMSVLGRTLNLTRRTRNSATGFYPETPALSTYTYRAPLHTDDGWAIGSLTSVGLDPKPLKLLVEHILNTHYEGFHTPYIHSLLIARHGKLVLEQYFYDHEREQAHDMRSAGKTFAGVLVGLALQQGARFTLDTPVYTVFPGHRSISNLDARKKAMTVKDLLTMTSGLACDDNDEHSPGNEDTMQSQHAQPDWYQYTLDLPMQRDPGGKQAVYCSAGINLLGGVVHNTLNMQMPEFFYQYYARPLGIRDYHINLMPTGTAYMGGGIRMRPRDQLKLGQLYLDGGKWHGRQVIAKNWVKQSLQAYSEFEPDHHYGFAWHIVDLRSGGKTYRTEEAGGNGGQFVLIIPALDMAVGFTAGNYGDFRTWYKFMTELVPQYIIPAAKDAGKH